MGNYLPSINPLQESSNLIKTTAVLTIISFIFFVTAYNSKGWIKGTDRRESTDNITSLQIGLWKTCFYDNVKQQDICQRTEDFLLEGWNEDWLPATNGILITAIIMNLLAAVYIISYVVVPLVHQYEALPIFTGACALFASCVFTFLGLLIIGIQQMSDYVNFYDTILDWCFWMTVTCTFLNAAACFLLMLEFNTMLDGMDKRKQLRQQERVLKALDQASIDTRNSNIETKNEDKNINDTRIATAEISSQSRDLKHKKSLELENPTYQRTSSENENSYMNINGNTDKVQSQNCDMKPSTSKPGNQNFGYRTHIDIHQSDTDSHETSDSEACLTTYSKQVIRPPKQLAVTNTGTNSGGKSTPIHLFQTQNSNINSENKNVEKKLPPIHLFQTKLDYYKFPPLGPIPNKTSLNKGPMLKMSVFHNDENRLTKSTPTELFVTDHMVKSQNELSKSVTVDSNYNKAAPTDLFLCENLSANFSPDVHDELHNVSSSVFI